MPYLLKYKTKAPKKMGEGVHLIIMHKVILFLYHYFPENWGCLICK